MRSGAEGGGGHCVGAQGQRSVPDTPPDSARRDIATPLPFPCTPTPPCRCAAASSTTRSFFQPSSTPRTARCPRAARARRGMVRTAALTTPHTRRARGRPCRTLRIASSCRACVRASRFASALAFERPPGWPESRGDFSPIQQRATTASGLVWLVGAPTERPTIIMLLLRCHARVVCVYTAPS